MGLDVKTESLEITGLPRGTKRALEEMGRRCGNVSAEEYARILLEAKILAEKPFREILAPVRKAFEDSGMSDEELATLIEKARQGFYLEGHTEESE